MDQTRLNRTVIVKALWHLERQSQPMKLTQIEEIEFPTNAAAQPPGRELELIARDHILDIMRERARRNVDPSIYGPEASIPWVVVDQLTFSFPLDDAGNEETGEIELMNDRQLSIAYMRRKIDMERSGATINREDLDAALPESVVGVLVPAESVLRKLKPDMLGDWNVFCEDLKKLGDRISIVTNDYRPGNPTMSVSMNVKAYYDNMSSVVSFSALLE